MIYLFNKITSVSGIVFILISILFLYIKISSKKTLSKTNILRSVFCLSSIAMIGSLIYSNLVGFPPCDLCWYQRIFMYPIVFISGLALYKKDFFIFSYIKMLAYIGGLIALFHNFIYYTNINPLPCSATASCTARYVYEFGFMTIPLMSLSIFVLILVLLSQRESAAN